MRFVAQLVAVVFCIFSPNVVVAQNNTAQQLYDALHMDILVDVIVSEGQEQVKDAAELYLSGRAIKVFIDQNRNLYQPSVIKERLIKGLDVGMTADQRSIALAFFQTETGSLAAELEATARQAISDQAIEDHAKAMVANAEKNKEARVTELSDAIEKMGLIDMNLAGAMTAQYHFLMPLAKVDALGLNQAEILNMIQEGQEEIIDNITTWLMAFTYMAYTPLGDEQLTTYLSYQMSENGAALNSALFDAFNGIDRDMSAAMGLALAQALQSQEL